MTTDTIRRRRRHSPQFKASVVAACLRPNTSVAQIAREHGLNANMVQTWIRNARQEKALPVSPGFVALPVPAPAIPMPRQTQESQPILIELPSTGGVITVQWPPEAADQCVRWLRTLLS
ncbi:MAG: IS66 family insertion sequence hypothetical protein [Oceanospirillaceae bacterium]|nr:IS66 family insertion sequence hypothetical protein [Oceanospirillaceae bacterium]